MTQINQKDRVELIRKGNALFNEGKIEMAAKVFDTVKYKDGLIRAGDYYYAKNELTQALVYYKKANYSKRIQQMAPNIAAVFKTWMNEDNG